MTAPILPGAEPWTHEGSLPHGVLVVHGFTGSPGSMRGLAEAFAAAGFHVEMPLLPGHGTSVEDMLATNWADWLRGANSAYAQLAARVDKVVVAGLSMGGALTLRLGLEHPEIAGLVCVNPATMSMPAGFIQPLQHLVDAGERTMAAISSDIADPEQTEIAYDATPIACLLSLVREGLIPIQDLYPSLRMPLLLCSSPNDHVVDPAQADHLASTYGGPVDRVILQRSFHVATQDFDKDLIFEHSVAFARRVTGS
jgi:carboxylesterase